MLESGALAFTAYHALDKPPGTPLGCLSVVNRAAPHQIDHHAGSDESILVKIPAEKLELTQIVQTVQKEPLVQEYSVLAGEAQRERRHSCFALDALMVVKVDIAVNHLVGFREGRRFVAVDTLRFEDGEEIFRHSVVIRVPTS